MATPVDSISELITSWNDLNNANITEFPEPPSALDFMRHVARNTPFVVRNFAQDWDAVKKWDAQYLKQFLGEHRVNVAVTPSGNADAPTRLDAGDEVVFAKPLEEDQSFGEFLDYVRDQELQSDGDESRSEVRYAQTQNDNLRHEYVSLFSQVERDIPFARIALEREPEAINLWIGNSRSTTALHKDPYENIYVQIAGQKHFVLLPGLCQPCVNERPLRPAIYTRDARGQLELRLEHPYINQGEERDGTATKVEREQETVPFATWDPDYPEMNATRYSNLARPVRVTLGPGDMLYLPAMWYHKVSQSCSQQGLCIAVNYWYDMDFNGSLYCLNSFVRSAALAEQSRV